MVLPGLVVMMVVITTLTVMRVSVLEGCRAFQLDFQKSGVLKLFMCPKFPQKYFHCIYMEEPEAADM